MAVREGFGNERYELCVCVSLFSNEFQNLWFFGIAIRYEKADFQQKVLSCYDKLYDDSYWQKIDADRSVNELTDVLKQYADETILAVVKQPLNGLW